MATKCFMLFERLEILVLKKDFAFYMVLNIRERERERERQRERDKKTEVSFIYTNDYILNTL